MHAFLPLFPLPRSCPTTTTSRIFHSPHPPHIHHLSRPRNPPLHIFCTDSSRQQQQPPSLPSRLARAFIDSCQPGRKSYTTALRDFCHAALAAYRAGYTLQALNIELGIAGTVLGLATLKHDEVELRTVWLTLVYKTLRALGHSGGGEEAGAAGEEGQWKRDGMDGFVSSIVGAVRAGYDMKRIQLEQRLAQEGNTRNPLESAVLGQSTRLVVTTVAVADEEFGSGTGGA